MKRPEQPFDPKPKRDKIDYDNKTYRLPSKLVARFNRQCKRQGRSGSDLLAEILEWAVEDMERG